MQKLGAIGARRAKTSRGGLSHNSAGSGIGRTKCASGEDQGWSESIVSHCQKTIYNAVVHSSYTKPLLSDFSRAAIVCGLCLLLLPCTINRAAGADNRGLVDEFTNRILKKDRIPNVRQYYQYCQKAEGDDFNEELRMGTEICLRNNWVPVHEHPDCMRYISRRRPHPESHRFPSLFFAWLRTQLPAESNAQITRTQALTENNIKYELIQTRLAGKSVVFKRPVSDDKKIGKICVISIDGASVNTLLDEYLLASQQHAPRRGDSGPGGDLPADVSRAPAPPSEPAELQEPLIDD